MARGKSAKLLMGVRFPLRTPTIKTKQNKIK